jgi:hypothetical protein
MTSVTTLVPGLGGAIGCDFRRTQNQLVCVEYGSKPSALNLAAPAHTVLGAATINTNSEDVKVSQDGIHAYVDERSGDLVRANLSGANRTFRRGCRQA